MKFFVFLFFLLILLFLISLSISATREEIIKDPEKYPELQEYKRIFFENLTNQEMTIKEKCEKIIKDYKDFIKNHPKSEFIDEAKLRIAEAYKILSDDIKSYEEIIKKYEDFIKNHPKSELVDEAKFKIAEAHKALSEYKISSKDNKNFGSEALRYLNDIIKNHPKANYFTLTLAQEDNPEEIENSGKTKTAAWALYYRGAWFKREESINDWEKVLKEYPESKEPVLLSRLELLRIFPSKYKEKEKSKKPDKKPERDKNYWAFIA